MVIRDLLGNELKVGDPVVIKLDHIIGVVSKIDTGEIARGVSLAGDKPQGEISMPMVMIQVAFTTMATPQPNGQVMALVKVSSPDADKKVTV